MNRTTTLILSTAILVSGLTLSGLALGQSGPQHGPPQQEQNQSLTEQQQAVVKAILSKYNAATLTAEQARAIHEQFRAAGLRAGPAMGNPNYTIDEQLTARAGSTFLAALADSQRVLVTGLVDIQKSDLYKIVDARQAISEELRQFLSGAEADSATVVSLSRHYGELDGEIVYNHAAHFAQVGQSLSDAQQSGLTALADSLGYTVPTGAFLYSRPIGMPEIPNTDFLFGGE